MFRPINGEPDGVQFVSQSGNTGKISKNLTVHNTQIEAAIGKMNSSKAIGPGGISAVTLKQTGLIGINLVAYIDQHVDRYTLQMPSTHGRQQQWRHHENL